MEVLLIFIMELCLLVVVLFVRSKWIFQPQQIHSHKFMFPTAAYESICEVTVREKSFSVATPWVILFYVYKNIRWQGAEIFLVYKDRTLTIYNFLFWIIQYCTNQNINLILPLKLEHGDLRRTTCQVNDKLTVPQSLSEKISKLLRGVYIPSDSFLDNNCSRTKWQSISISLVSS